MVMYFTSEADAREGERKEIPPKLQANMEEMNKITVGEPEFFDLQQPVILAKVGQKRDLRPQRDVA
jgi:hypothetical protein